jgi:fumarate reductase (CoM/CoB) subunit A
MPQYETVSTDVLVLGAGAAGIRASIAAYREGAELIIAAKSEVGESGSTFSKISKGWGIQGLVGKERTNDNMKVFYDEIINVGLEQCELGLVEKLVEESGERVDDLMSYGIRFKKDTHGGFFRVNGCFSDFKRAFLTDNFVNIQQSFTSIMRRLPAKVVTGFVLDLIISENVCWGAWIVTDTGKITRINAKATILATGGGAGVFKDHMVSNNDVGDGYALAYRAGAELVNMEFIQFMLGLKHNCSRDFLSFGDPKRPVVLEDSMGGDLLERYIPDSFSRAETMKKRLSHGPFSCRDTSYLLDLAVAQERNQGKRVYASNGKGAEVVHFAHAFNGGIRINDRSEVTIPGLYAAGEVAAGPHGADRIGGCMMTATQVFGERAGRFAAIRSRNMRSKPMYEKVITDVAQIFTQFVTSDVVDNDIGSIAQRIKNTMNKNVMIIRNLGGLQECLCELNDCNENLNQIGEKSHTPSRLWFEIRNMITTAKLITSAALKRNESRGSHFRSDFPAT